MCLKYRAMVDIKINIRDSPSHNEWLERIRSYRIQNKSRSNRPKIQNMPQILSLIESNKKCYDPLVVSIGTDEGENIVHKFIEMT